MTARRTAAFPRIVRDPAIVSGEPVVRGSRVPVRVIAQYHREYDLPRLHEAFPHLDTADIEEALAYYAAHRAEIDRYIRENEADDDR